MTQNDQVLLELASYLSTKSYVFICPTPESQERVVTKRRKDAKTRHCENLSDFFGWSLSASVKTIDQFLGAELRKKLQNEGVIVQSDYEKDGESSGEEEMLKSTLRVSNLYMPRHGSRHPKLQNPYYYHSAFPTTASDAIFLGPDTYMYLDFLRSELPFCFPSALLPSQQHPSLPSNSQSRTHPRVAIDVCCGSGAGALHITQHYPSTHTIGLDMNPRALELAPINAKLHSSSTVEFAYSDLFASVASRTDIDLIVSNPPYIASSDTDHPTYSAGGAQQGLELPLRIIEEGVELLAPGGFLLMYTGVPIEYRRTGYDAFLEYLKGVEGCKLVSYVVIVPDFFGEELTQEAYADVGRIQIVGCVVRKDV